MSYPVPPEGLPQDPGESFTKKQPIALTHRDQVGIGLATLLSVLWVFCADGNLETARFSLEFFTIGGIGLTLCMLTMLVVLVFLQGGLKRLGRTARMLLAATALTAIVPSISANHDLRLANALVLLMLYMLDFLLISGCSEHIVLTMRGGVASVSFFCRHQFAHVGVAYRALRKKPIASECTRAIIIGIALAGCILLVVLPLLFSADEVFARIVDTFFDWNLESGGVWLVRIIRIAVIVPITFSLLYAVIHALGKDCALGEKLNKPQVSNVLIATTLVLIDAVYALFVLVQITYLFGGVEASALHGGYAQYARSGFFELVVVTAINLALTLLALAVRKREERTAISSTLLYVLLAMTLVMLVSAAQRMTLYTVEFGLSMLRAMTYMGMVAILALVIIAAVRIHKPDVPVFKLGVSCLSVIWLVFALSNPAARIAAFNVDGYLGGSLRQIDVEYLYDLGPDSVPALKKLASISGTDAAKEEARMCLDGMSCLYGQTPWSYRTIREMIPNYFPVYPSEK